MALPGGGSVPTDYLYNGDGLRVRKVDSFYSPTDYTYDVNRALPEVLEDNGYIYVYGHGLLAQVARAGGAEAYPHADGLGSVRVVTDAAGAVQARYDRYDAFGTPTLQAGTPTGDRRFGGQQLDAESGNSSLRARSDDPAAGRCPQPDPLGRAAGTRWHALCYPTSQQPPGRVAR